MPDSYRRRFIKQLIIALVGIVIIATIIIILNSDINKRMQRIELRQKESLLQTQAILILSELKKESEIAKTNYALIETALPTRDQLISLPRELEQLAKKTSVDLGFSFGSETPSTDSQPGSIRFTMSLGGAMNDLLNFLKVFETNKYYINLSSVDISKKEGDRFSLGTTGEIFTR